MLLKTWTRYQSALHSDEGASLVEYALLVALIALAAIVAIRAVGTQLETNFTDIETELQNIPD